jgi:hypothetical protein
MFYNDRFADAGELDRMMLVGRGFRPDKVSEISNDALGRSLQVISPDDVGLNIPAGSMTFDDLAAPAGLAALGWG